MFLVSGLVVALAAPGVSVAAATPERHFPLTVKGVVEDAANAPVADAQVLVAWVITKPTSVVSVEQVCAGVAHTRTDAKGAYRVAYRGSPLSLVSLPGELGRGVVVLIHKPGLRAPLATTVPGTDRTRPKQIPTQSTSGETPRQTLDRLAELQSALEICRNSGRGAERTLHSFDRGLFAEARTVARTPEEKGIALRIGTPLVLSDIRRAGWRSQESLTLEHVDHILGGRIEAVMAYAALKEAVKGGNRDMAESMLASGVDPNFEDGYSWSLLGHAIRKNHPQLALVLLEAGARLRSDEQSEALGWALFKGYVDVADALLSQGIPMRTSTDSASSSLHGAVVRSDAQVVALLLRHGADPNALTPKGDTPLNLARRHEIVTELLAAGADPNIPSKRGGHPLVTFVRAGYADTVEALLRAGADPNTTDSRGEPVIMMASGGVDVGVVRSLLSRGADVNASFHNGSPVTRAAYEGNADMVRLLIDSGADLSGATGSLALYHAARKDLAIVRMLVEAGAPVNTQYDPSYPAPLNAAASAGRLQIVTYLIEKGADVNARGDKERSALMAAANRGKVTTIDMLVAAGAVINATDSEGMTAVMYAIDPGFRDRQSAAAKDKSDCNRAPAAHTPTSTAPRESKPPVTKEIQVNEDLPSHEKGMTLIISSGSGATVIDPSPPPPRHCREAPVPLKLDVLRSLLAHGAIPDLQEHRDGWSALMMAAQIDAPSAVELLLSQGANKNIKNRVGDKAIDIARRAGSTTVVPLLDDQ